MSVSTDAPHTHLLSRSGETESGVPHEDHQHVKEVEIHPSLQYQEKDGTEANDAHEANDANDANENTTQRLEDDNSGESFLRNRESDVANTNTQSGLHQDKFDEKKLLIDATMEHNTTKEEYEAKKLFIDNLSTLSSLVNDTILEIADLGNSIIRSNNNIKSYSNYMKNTKSFLPFSSFIELSPEQRSPTSHSNSSSSSNQSPCQIPTLDDFETKLFSANIPFIPGTRIPDIDLNAQAKTVKDIWDEWTVGYKHFPALSSLEGKFGTRWRRGRIAKSAQRRKKVIEFIENEYKLHSHHLKDIEQVVNDLDTYRLSQGKGLFWLYGALPETLYDDSGDLIYKLTDEMRLKYEKQMEKRQQLNRPGPKKQKVQNGVFKIHKKPKNPNNRSARKQSRSKKSLKLKEGLTSKLPIKDSPNEDSKMDIDQAIAKGGTESDVEKDIAPPPLQEKQQEKQHQHQQQQQQEQEQQQLPQYQQQQKQLQQKQTQQQQQQQQRQQTVQVDQKNADLVHNDLVDQRVIRNNEEEEDDDEDDDDVNIPSAAQVAAMAALSVDGDDEEHSLVNSAALAVAAQHVAAQQRKREQEYRSTNRIDHDDEDNTDPALSKL